jgi:hypothetical protein
MKSRALGWLMASGLFISSSLTAEPLNELRARLTAMRSVQPIRLQVDIELEHSDREGLVASRGKAKGKATVDYGPKGVKVHGSRWKGSFHSSSFGNQEEPERIAMPLLDKGEAELLVDPAGVMDFLLRDASLLREESTTWQGQVARRLVFLPTTVGEKAASSGAFWRFSGEIELWLGDGGAPLAMRHTMRLNGEPAVAVKREQLLIFQQIEGRLLGARTEDTFSGAAVGWDARTATVSVDR